MMRLEEVLMAWDLLLDWLLLMDLLQSWDGWGWFKEVGKGKKKEPWTARRDNLQFDYEISSPEVNEVHDTSNRESRNDR